MNTVNVFITSKTNVNLIADSENIKFSRIPNDEVILDFKLKMIENGIEHQKSGSGNFGIHNNLSNVRFEFNTDLTIFESVIIKHFNTINSHNGSYNSKPIFGKFKYDIEYSFDCSFIVQKNSKTGEVKYKFISLEDFLKYNDFQIKTLPTFKMPSDQNLFDEEGLLLRKSISLIEEEYKKFLTLKTEIENDNEFAELYYQAQFDFISLFVNLN